MPESKHIIRAVRLLWRVATAAVCAWGLAVMTGITAGKFNSSLLCYYTVQSNLVCLIYALVLAAADLAGRRIRHERIAGAVTSMILVTMLVYNLILDRTGFSMTSNMMEIANMIVHLAVPLMIFADWIFFAEKGRLRRREPFLWMAIPLAYYFYVLARAALAGPIPGRNSRFPYFFIDSDVLGALTVARNVAVLIVMFLLLGYFLVGVDRLLARVAGFIKDRL